MMKKKILVLGSGMVASVFMTGATFAKVPPKMPNRAKVPIALVSTVSHVSSSNVVIKTMGPSHKTITVTASQVSSHSTLPFSALTSGEHVMLQKSSNGWMISQAPTPPTTGVVTNVGSSTISVKEMRPGHSATVRTIRLDQQVIVKDGATKESVSAIKSGDHVSIQDNAGKMTINVMPTPPKPGKLSHAAPKPGKPPKLKAPHQS